jgi:single-strand DNA-binding protein
MVPWTNKIASKGIIMKNTVTLVGFVGNDPEVRETKSDATITNISLATTRSYKDSEGERQQDTEWHRITCFNGIGKCVAEHVTKGAMIMVTGRIHYTKWTDDKNVTRYGCEIIAEQVDFLSKAKAKSSD